MISSRQQMQPSTTKESPASRVLDVLTRQHSTITLYATIKDWWFAEAYLRGLVHAVAPHEINYINVIVKSSAEAEYSIRFMDGNTLAITVKV